MSSLLSSQRSLVTLIAQFAEGIIATEPGSWTRGSLESRLELLRSYWSRLQSSHLELVGKGRFAEDPYFTANVFEHTEATVLEAFSYLHDERNRLDSTQHVTAQPTPVTQRLPRIDLPTFDGTPKDWEPFRDLYVALVHTNTTLTDVQKLCHLKSALQGEAKGALDSVPITDANYVTAWNLLLRRYDNKRLLIQESIATLISINGLKRENATELQSLLDTLSRKRESLRALGRPVEQWDDWFTFIAARGMDSQTRRDWEHELQGVDKIPSFVEVESFLQRKVWALKATEASSLVTLPVASTSRGHKPNPRGNTRLMAVSTSKGTCGHCGDQHYLGHCAELRKQTPDQRRKVVTQLRLCFNCLRDGHVARECPSKSRCQTCKALHHTLLHRSAESKRPNPAAQASAAKRPRLDASGSSKCEQSPSSTA